MAQAVPVRPSSRKVKMESLPPAQWCGAEWTRGRPAAAPRLLSIVAVPAVCASVVLATLAMPTVWHEPASTTGAAAAFAGTGVTPMRHPPRTLPEQQLQPPLASPISKVRVPPAQSSAPAPVRRGGRFLSVASRLGGIATTAGTAAVAAVCAAVPRRRNRDGSSRRRLQGFSSGVAAGLPAALKAFSESNVALMLRLSTLYFCKIYMAMLVLRITIMWFPNINPYRQPFYSMIQLTDPYLNLFRGWMPPIFGIDLSVILAFVVIQAGIDTLTVSPF
uniref:Uncharacterized protein n=1 Tax=Alexandrium monilatum TaxID=311494 RepID=A0A7S4R5L4_9DINO